MLLEQAKEMLMLAKQEVHSAQYEKIKNTAVSVKNEVMEMIAKVRERKGRLDLPIVSGKHLRRISDRNRKSNAAALDSQSANNAEKFITTRKIDSSLLCHCHSTIRIEKIYLIQYNRVSGRYLYEENIYR